MHGCNSPKDLRCLLEMKASNAFFSFATTKKIPDLLEKGKINFAFDSGAYTNKQKAGSMTLPRYVNILKDNLNRKASKKCDFFLMLDVIGSKSKTLENFKKLKNKYKLPVTFVDQFVSRGKLKNEKDVHKRYIDEKILAIGCGANYSSTDERLVRGLDEVFEYAKKHNTKIHGLAIIGLSTLIKFPQFYSVDSQAWKWGSIWGRLTMYYKKGGEIKGVSASYRDEKARRLFKPIFDKNGWNMNDNWDRNKFNLMSLKRLEKFLNSTSKSEDIFGEFLVDQFTKSMVVI